MPTAQELSGSVLHGDDFSTEEIVAWYRDEENAYAELYAENPEYEYEYEPLNRLNGFDHLPSGRRFEIAVGFGSAYGDELRPVEDRISRLIVIESADTYQKTPALNVPTEWRKAAVSGDIDLPDSTADLVTCFGVLHHIPNVTHVLSELGRITKPGGYALVREPVVTMGDWSKPRAGLTPRERGIPRDYLIRSARDAGFVVERETWCFFTLMSLLARVLRLKNVYDNGWCVKVDALLARAFKWNYRYSAANRFQKVRPTSVFLVLRKGL